MALQAGRVGVHPSQVDLLGKIKMLPFIKRTAPWQSKGKWYKVVLRGGSTYTIESDDGLGIVVTTNLFTPINFLAIDFKISDVKFLKAPNANLSTAFLRVTSVYNWYQNLPASESVDYLVIWIFGYYANVQPTASLSNDVQSARKVAKASKVDEPVEETTDPVEEPINTDTE